MARNKVMKSTLCKATEAAPKHTRSCVARAAKLLYRHPLRSGIRAQRALPTPRCIVCMQFILQLRAVAVNLAAGTFVGTFNFTGFECDSHISR